ncbi:MAG: uracil-xanthine permease [Clostridia bacterium]|nr:uracil-xanthine permease [Clostridia bacterium]
MQLIYKVEDKPKFLQLLIFALQQLLSIMTATLVVPVIIGNNMSPAAALVGAGVGTLVYVAFTKKKSPVFLGSSFAFIGSMFAAFAGGVSMSLGYLGLIIGAVFAGMVYVIIAVLVKFAGVGWINKLMPAAVVGPTVAIIGLSLAGNAVGDVLKFATYDSANAVYDMSLKGWLGLLCALVTLFTVIICSTYGKKWGRLIPFIFGILGGYAVAGVLTIIGYAAGIDALKLVDVAPFTALLTNGAVTIETFVSVPNFTFLTAFKGFGEITPDYLGTIAVAYIPVAFVVFAEHLADHKNISSIIEKDLLEEPGLHRTLLGDGIGSMFGAFFGGCPNTTYGESVGCVAITRNASVYTIIAAAIMSIVIAFVSPFIAFVSSIPSSVMGGVCMALYGFIAVSGLKMVQTVNLNVNKNLFVVSAILISGIGGMALRIGQITLTAVACPLILGIVVNLIVSKAKDEE